MVEPLLKALRTNLQALSWGEYINSFFKNYLFLFIYLTAPDCSWQTQDLQPSLQHAGSSSLIRDQTRAPCIGSMQS